jgi:hypothetical protein
VSSTHRAHAVHQLHMTAKRGGGGHMLSPLAKALVAHVGEGAGAAVVKGADNVARGGKPIIPSKLSKELTSVISQIVQEAAAQSGKERVSRRAKGSIVHGSIKAEAPEEEAQGQEAEGDEGDEGHEGQPSAQGSPGVVPEGDLAAEGEPVPSPLDSAGEFLDKSQKGNLDAGLINATSVSRSVVGGVGSQEQTADESGASHGWLAYKRIPVTYVAWLCAALCVVVTMLLSTQLILRHLDYYANPDTQKYVVRILFIAPIYAVDSLLALTFVGWATTYIDVFRDCYEAFTIYNFLKLMVVLLGGERAVIDLLEKRPQVTPR